MAETRAEAYKRFLSILGVDVRDEAPSHRIAFNIAWHAAVEQIRRAEES